jgi:cellulose synthase/poly-beta-1,6-N-acetylglucosamine synthase-like glycosyltransferase
MDVLAACLVVVLSALITLTAAASIQFGLRVRRYCPHRVSDSHLPEAAIILSIRGRDASLRRVLDQLAQQRYPRYRLYVVVDHATDPAWPIVQRWQRSRPPVRLQVELLRERLPYATLKYSAVRQVLDELPPEVEAVVLVDGDADPYAHWLRDLVSPLVCDRQIGAVTGNRWYFPRRGGPGSWCRFVFNGGALPFMEAGGHSWGGSLALRRDFVDSPAFRDSFGPLRLPTEEQAVFKGLRAAGLRLHFTPYAVLWNRESTTVTDCWEFTARQLAWARLYFPVWDSILIYAVAACLATAAAMAAGSAILTGRVVGPWPATIFALGVAYWIVAVASLAWLHRLFRLRIMPRQGRTMPPFTFDRLAAAALYAPLALFVYAAAAVKARLMRGIRWRGIYYEILPPCSIRLTAYRPLAEVGPRRTERPIGAAPAPQV